jgi:hypothetical protein
LIPAVSGEKSDLSKTKAVPAMREFINAVIAMF